MISLLITKALVLSAVWTIGSFVYSVISLADPTPKRLLIIFAPWLVWLGYFTIFYWG